MRKGEDLETILLLYDSTQVNAFDLNFCKIAEQNGLFCRKVDLSRAKMSDDLLRDQQGSYCRLIGISADTLLKPPALLDGEEIAIIKSAVEKEGISLFVGKAKKYPNANLLTATNPLTELTDGAIIGIRQPRQAPHTGWSVSASAPEITGLFTGQVIPAASPPRREFSPVISGRQRVTTLITSTNEVETYPIFVRCQKGSGSIFIDAGASAESLETSQVRDVFDQEDFSEITPLMMTLRYAMGNRAWHVNRDYASLGEGMPVPAKPFGLLNFTVALD